MGKFKDRIFGVLLFFISIMLWLYTLLISANIPMAISKNEVKISVISLVLFGIIYSFYIIKSKNKSPLSLLSITCICFLTDTLNEFKYSYNHYNRVISLTGLIVIGICIMIGIYQIFKERKLYKIKEKQE